MSRTTKYITTYDYGETLKFGQFKGRTVSKDFIKSNISYFKWLVREKVCNFTEEILILIKNTPTPIAYFQDDYEDDMYNDYGYGSAWGENCW